MQCPRCGCKNERSRLCNAIEPQTPAAPSPGTMVFNESPTYPEGTYLAGVDIPAGEYGVFALGDYDCYVDTNLPEAVAEDMRA